MDNEKTDVDMLTVSAPISPKASLQCFLSKSEGPTWAHGKQLRGLKQKYASVNLHVSQVKSIIESSGRTLAPWLFDCWGIKSAAGGEVLEAGGILLPSINLASETGGVDDVCS